MYDSVNYDYDYDYEYAYTSEGSWEHESATSSAWSHRIYTGLLHNAVCTSDGQSLYGCLFLHVSA